MEPVLYIKVILGWILLSFGDRSLRRRYSIPALNAGFQIFQFMAKPWSEIQDLITVVCIPMDEVMDAMSILFPVYDCTLKYQLQRK